MCVQVAELASNLGQRIDAPAQARAVAAALHARSQALNPGERGGGASRRAHGDPRLEGWWTVPPVSESKARRA